MMEAVRNGAWAKAGGWVNPYVTNGLIAMWDGEWNAGPGVHDPNANGWSDVINGYEIIFSNRDGTASNNFEVHDNYYALGTVILTCEISGIKEILERTKEVTFEFVRFTKAKRIYNEFTYDYDFHRSRKGNVRLTDSDFMNSSQISHQSTSFSADGTVIAFTRNMKNRGTASDGFSVSDDNIILCGNEYPYADFTANGNTYTMRLYSRALSEKEIAANYAIDKARFNLP